MLTAAATKKTTIGVADNHQLTTLINSASTVLPIGLPPKGGQVLPHFEHIVSGVSMLPCPMVAVFKFLCGQLVGRSVGWLMVCWLVGWSTIRVIEL
jgi:hypothetical protein